MRLRELLREWTEAKAPRPQFVSEATASVEDYVDYHGDVAVSTITSEMIFDYRDAAKVLPRKMSQAERRLPFTERTALFDGTPTALRISATTLKKRVGAIQALLGFAHSERWIAANVGSKIPIVGYTRSVKERRSFRDGELQALFGSDLFLLPSTWFSGRTGLTDLTLHWLFLLGLTSGARLEEVGQARLADVQEDDGIAFIDIDDRENVVPAEPDTDGRSLKNEMSRRVVPIHDRLIELGFLEYVEAMRKLGQTMLFPDLKQNVFGKFTQEGSRRANRFIDKFVSKDRRLVFHSLRHRFKDEGRNVGVAESILDQLCGHSPATVGARYGEGADVKQLKRRLRRLRFSVIDWDAMVAASAGLKWGQVTLRLVVHTGRSA